MDYETKELVELFLDRITKQHQDIAAAHTDSRRWQRMYNVMQRKCIELMAEYKIPAVDAEKILHKLLKDVED